MSSARAITNFLTKYKGRLHTPDFGAYCFNKEKPVSFLHDIPLSSQEGTLNLVVEIPRWTQAKCEISNSVPLNPIMHDIKNKKIRYVQNCFPYHGYIWNYGAFPQTFEDPVKLDARTNLKGDGDPIDVCEIGGSIGYIGQIKQVKVLGALALLDQNETDWKILTIDINDPMANSLNDIDDVKKIMPRLLTCTRDWFAVYKIPDGKSKNTFGLSGEFLPKSVAKEIINECHTSWKMSSQRADHIHSFLTNSEKATQITQHLEERKESSFPGTSSFPSIGYYYQLRE
ncbi:inorganic diphosphatase [Schizosaccharomyces cryophilus OY26]|uniref:inorganic diphosphatase n=1 Tax=Schizosaccharomyces cryophilus (strain OY26 / ATCC MYA-4695 / CBS 11777 / NBRC 106824 / NRRL Y48691) TaxID=653667 RepID=S9X1D1_SCHCR|nr:inorganic diphosphatase [Schizosaccharomyces cryophilus OY26]EPY50947.1 inorganic diphosphatase [Schizosaccharomyces cryophilus OY26]